MLISKLVTCRECGEKYYETFWIELQDDEGICDKCLDCMDNE